MTTVQRTIALVPACFAAVMFIAAILAMGKKARARAGARGFALGAALFASAITAGAFIDGARYGAQDGYGWTNLMLVAAAVLFVALTAWAPKLLQKREETGFATLPGLLLYGKKKGWTILCAIVLLLGFAALAVEQIGLGTSILRIFLGIDPEQGWALLAFPALLFAFLGERRTAKNSHVWEAVLLFAGIGLFRYAVLKSSGGAEAAQGALRWINPQWNIIYNASEKLLFSGLPAWQVAAGAVLSLPLLCSILLGAETKKAALRGSIWGGILLLLFLLILGAGTTYLPVLVRQEEVEVLVGDNRWILLAATLKSMNPVAAGFVFSMPLMAIVSTVQSTCIASARIVKETFFKGEKQKKTSPRKDEKSKKKTAS